MSTLTFDWKIQVNICKYQQIRKCHPYTVKAIGSRKFVLTPFLVTWTTMTVSPNACQRTILRLQHCHYLYFCQGMDIWSKTYGLGLLLLHWRQPLNHFLQAPCHHERLSRIMYNHRQQQTTCTLVSSINFIWQTQRASAERIHLMTPVCARVVCAGATSHNDT